MITTPHCDFCHQMVEPRDDPVLADPQWIHRTGFYGCVDDQGAGHFATVNGSQSVRRGES